MNLTIELPDRTAAAIEAHARAAHMPPDRYLAEIISRAMDRQHQQAVKNLEGHIEYMASQAGNTTTEEMEAALGEALAAVRSRRNWRT
jgi:hypothetical protein